MELHLIMKTVECNFLNVPL